MIALSLALMVVPISAQVASEQPLAGLLQGRSQVTGDGARLVLTLGLSAAQPWSARVLSDPARLLIDVKGADFSLLDPSDLGNIALGKTRFGRFRPGWARLVVTLRDFMTIDEAVLIPHNKGADLRVILKKATPEAFDNAASRPEPAFWIQPNIIKTIRLGEDLSRQKVYKPSLTLVLDPGHGGLDPGAIVDGTSEAEMMLAFAFELKTLFNDKGVETIMTRQSDVFVPLEARSSIARFHGADVFLSLHADALPLGEALGVTIYTMNETASEQAAATLAQRHDRDDILAGVDLAAQDEQVTKALMAMARLETMPRTSRLAQEIKKGILAKGLEMYSRPVQSAAFSVLKSPDIPSVLIELGFLTSTTDFSRLNDVVWRSAMQNALVDAVVSWAKDDPKVQQYFSR